MGWDFIFVSFLTLLKYKFIRGYSCTSRESCFLFDIFAGCLLCGLKATPFVCLCLFPLHLFYFCILDCKTLGAEILSCHVFGQCLAECVFASVRMPV